MSSNRWVVVREEKCTMCFSIFHQTGEEAIEEAARLCKKENHKFLVLKVIADVAPQDRPIAITKYK